MTYVAMRGNAKKTAPGISARRFSLAALLFLILVAASRSSIKKFHFQNSNEGGRRILLKESSIDDIIKEYPLSMHVTVAKINVPSPFLYAYLYEDQDSYQVSDANIRALEPGITALLVEKIATCCGSGGHFIDVGSHFGYYSMLAASLGCSYSAFEPVPAFQKLIKLNQVLNGVQHQGDVYEFAIGDVEAEALIKVPSTGVLGLARIKRYENGTLINPAHRNQTEGEILTVKTRRMNSKKYNIPTTDKRICAMKIDVEGDEPYVIAGSLNLLKTGRVEHIVTEYSPVFNCNGEHMRGMLKTLHELGYDAYHANWQFVKQPKPVESINTTTLYDEKLSFATDEERKAFTLLVSSGNTNIWFEKKHDA